LYYLYHYVITVEPLYTIWTTTTQRWFRNSFKPWRC